MRKLFISILFLLLTAVSVNLLAEDGITFQVEELSKPEFLLRNTHYSQIYEHLILNDLGLSHYYIEKDSVEFPYNILTKSQAQDSLVYFGYNSFFNGMYEAYSDHRPFVLSPDMIWLLISQGFALHVLNNAEELRHNFVDFTGKLTLIVRTEDNFPINDSKSWEKIFPQFTNQIGKFTGNELIGVLTPDFTTTSPVERIAAEITIMKAMEAYFEYIVFSAVCGIPEITLQGTPEDWQKVLDKTMKLGKYDLEWWTDKLEPILEEFVDASKGDVSKSFWRNMFKAHSQKEYGAPEIIDGWIVKFFPYDKYGKRNNLKKLEGGSSLPEEIVKVDVIFSEIKNDGTTINTPLELWAGFIGLEQNPENFALTPKIGWMVREKDTEKVAFKARMEKSSKPNKNLKGISFMDDGISIRVKEIPSEILDLETIHSLYIEFIDGIRIPDDLAKVKIESLTLYGEIKKSEIERIKCLFPNTVLMINGETINKK